MLKLCDLKKNYQNFSLRCSLELPKGRVSGIVGQNGAGKSTLFKAILGLIPHDAGRIQLLGKDLKAFTPQDRQQLGVVLSDSGFSGYLTVGDLIPVLKALYRQFDERFFVQQLQHFELPLHKQLKEFSTGMKAKLKVLVAISHKAQLLLLDEPTSGLDVVARDELLFLLREYMEQDEQRSILISSHISSDLESFCDDIYMLHRGQVILHADTDVLLSDYALLKMDQAQYETLDRQYILRTRQESYGYCCLTDQRRYYRENYPQIFQEQGSIDGVITMMLKGE